MIKNLKILLILLLLTTLFKGIIWSAVVPIWHIPDEQAHFAQVQYYAELKKGIESGNDLSYELAESEKLLGTFRDERGNNKFTYHPEYKIEYSQSMTGVHEKTIEDLPISSRTTFVKKEAAEYPPLFYILSSIGYLIGNSFSLFVRLALTRFISVLFAVATVWISFLLARSIFPKNGYLCIFIAALVSFQPMFTFLSSGVNNDNLLNLLSTALLFVMVDAIRNGLTTKRSIAMGAILGLGILTKQLIYPFIPLPFIVIAYEMLIRKKKLDSVAKKIFPLILIAILFGGIVFINQWIRGGKLPYWPEVNPESPRYEYSINEYLSEKIPQLYRETLPWYWGVFKWLGVVLPLPILRAIKVAVIISFIGISRYIYKKFKQKRFSTKDWQLLFLIFSSIWFALVLLAWDYMLIRSIGFSHGIQGRNFFPNIAAHMTLLAFGFWQLTQKHKFTVAKIAVLLMVILNFIAFKTVLDNYYTIYPLSTLLLQISQYKAWFFKGIWLIVWVVIYLAIISQFIVKFTNVKKVNQATE